MSSCLVQCFAVEYEQNCDVCIKEIQAYLHTHAFPKPQLIGVCQYVFVCMYVCM